MSQTDQTYEGPRLVFDLGGTYVRTAFVHSSGAIDPDTRKSVKIAKTITTRERLRDLIVEMIVSRGLQQRMHVLSLAGPISADNRVIRNTEPCNCGSRGCVELSTSGTGVVRNFNRRTQDFGAYAESALYRVRGRAPGSIRAEDIAWAAAREDRFTLALLRDAARALSLLLKNVFTSHPAMTVVLVGGFALGVGIPLLTSVREALIEIGIPFIKRSELAEYVESRLLLGRIPGNDTNLVGARLFLSQAERSG